MYVRRVLIPTNLIKYEFLPLLTDNQLFHLFPLNIVSRFMSNGNRDPPLNALWSRETWVSFTCACLQRHVTLT